MAQRDVPGSLQVIVRIGGDGTASLEDMENFKAFKLVSAAAENLLVEAVAKIGRLDGEHVWIARGWLEQHGRPRDDQWLARLENMVQFAREAGWVDRDGAIRAHIEVVHS